MSGSSGATDMFDTGGVEDVIGAGDITGGADDIIGGAWDTGGCGAKGRNGAGAGVLIDGAGAIGGLIPWEA